MLLLLVLACILQHHACLADPPSQEPNNPPALDRPSERSLSTILWGCFSTMILCAWASVHPNIPPPEESNNLKGLWRKLKLLFWALITPELVLLCAVKQFAAAKASADSSGRTSDLGYPDTPREKKSIRKIVASWFTRQGREESEHTAPAWTITHGFFLIMGGFTIKTTDSVTGPGAHQSLAHPTYVSSAGSSFPLPEINIGPSHEARPGIHKFPGPPTDVLLTEQVFHDLKVASKLPFGAAESDIKRRSKENFLPCIIAILQASWFFTQCLARRAKGYVATQLELLTITMVLLYIVMYIFWWHKPLDVRADAIMTLDLWPPPKGLKPELEAKSIDQPVTPPELTFRKITSVVSDISNELLGKIRLVLLSPCKQNPIIALFGLLVLLPFYVVLLLAFPLFAAFPSATLFLLNVMTLTRISDSKQREASGRILDRILLTLDRNVSRIISSIRQVFVTWLVKIVKRDPYTILIFRWFCLLPFLFLLLTLAFIFLTPQFVLLFIIIILTSALDVVASSEIPSDARHVPIFFAPHFRSYPLSAHRSNRNLYLLSSLWILTAVCCTIHISDAYPFRGPLKIFWICATVINFCSMSYWADFEMLRFWYPTNLHTSDILRTIHLIYYLTARLSLIVLSLVFLRRQPPEDAFRAVDWTKYLPHFQ